MVGAIERDMVCLRPCIILILCNEVTAYEQPASIPLYVSF